MTLVELVIVLMMLGILTTVASPQLLSSIESARLDAVTSEVVTAHQFAQSSAMASGRPCRVRVDAITETVTLEQVQYTKLTDILNVANTQLVAADVETSTAYAAMKHPLRRTTSYTVDFKAVTWFSGINIVSVVYGTGSNVVYDGQGAPSTGAVVTLAYGDRQAVVSVSSSTGAVTVQ